jgi:preprotein translocase subunit YajC
MNNAPLGLNELGFWLAVAIVVVAFIWAKEKKKQRQHELTLKLLEKGQDVNQELLAKLLASDQSGAPAKSKSTAERRHQEGGTFVAMFLFAGVIFAFLGMAMQGHTMQPVAGAAGQGPVPMMMWVDTGPNWLLIGLGAFCFLFGLFCMIGVEKEYKRAKAEEKQTQD